MKGKTMTIGNSWKHIAFFALPVFMGILLQQLYNSVDALIVANFAGGTSLAEVGGTICLNLFFIALAHGFSAGSGIIISQEYGKNNRDGVRNAASTAIIMLFCIGIVTTILGVILCEPILKYLLASPEKLIEGSVAYFRIYSLGLVFLFGYNAVACILRAMGDSKASLYFLLISAIVNVILDVIFVGVLNWGVEGAALGTDIAAFGACAAGFIYMYKKYPTLHFNINEYTFSSDLARKMYKKGFSMSLRQMVVSFGSIFIQRAVNAYGPQMIESFILGQKTEIYLNMPANAFQVAAANFVAQNIGAGNIKRADRGARQAALMSFAITFMVSLGFVFLTRPIINLFHLKGLSAFFAEYHIRTISCLMLILAAYYPMVGLVQGAESGYTPAIIAITVLLLRVVSVYTLRNVPFFGYRIIWWNMVFGLVGGFMVTWIHYFKWRRKALTNV